MGRGPNRPDQDTDENEYEDREPDNVGLGDFTGGSAGGSSAGDSHAQSSEQSAEGSSDSGGITEKIREFASQGNEAASGEGQTEIGDYGGGSSGNNTSSEEGGTATLSPFSNGNPARALLGVAAIARTADNTTDSVESDDFTEGAQRLYEETREQVGE